MRHSTLGFCFALAGVVLGLGCSTTLERSTEKIVTKSLEAVNEQGNRGRVEDLLTSEEVREATRKLTGVVLDTAVEDLTGDELRERLHEISIGFVEDVTPALAQAFDEEVWPEIRDKLEEALALALDQVLSEETLARLREFTAETAAEVIRQTAPELVESISAGLTKGIEDAFETVLAQLVPVLEGAFERDHGPAARELARNVAHGALLGVADAMNDAMVNQVFDRERDEILERIKDPENLLPFKVGLGVLGLLLAVGTVVLVRMWQGLRRRDQEIDRLIRQLRGPEGG